MKKSDDGEVEERDQERGLWAPLHLPGPQFPQLWQEVTLGLVCARPSPQCARDKPLQDPPFLANHPRLLLAPAPLFTPAPHHDSPWYSRPRRGLAGLRERVGPGESGSRILQLASVQQGLLTSACLSFLGPTSLSESFFLFLFICLAVCLSLSLCPPPPSPCGSLSLCVSHTGSLCVWFSLDFWSHILTEFTLFVNFLVSVPSFVALVCLSGPVYPSL